jgi:dienelactone hydrolase
MWLPRGAGPHPVVLAQHGANGSKESVYLANPAQRWAARGLAVLAMDAPDHGGRAGAAAGMLDRVTGAVNIERFREFVRDLRHLIDVVASIESLDATRLGFVGWSMGALAGVPLTAVDERVRAGVYCIAGSLAAYVARKLPPEVAEHLIGLGDPASYAPMISPRPVLQVNTTGDEIFSVSSARALFDAFGEPKTLLLRPGTHAVWPEAGDMYRAMWGFLARQLGLPASRQKAS